jgi:hypothetical protein
MGSLIEEVSMTFRRFSKRAIVASLFLGILLAGSVAFAWWTAGGTGNGYTKAETAQQLTTNNVSATTTAQLHPGGTSDVILQIANPNTYAVTVTNINGNGAITSGNATCDNPNAPYTGNGVTFTNQSGTWVVPAGNTLDVTLTGAAAMSNTATTSNDSCQGKVFTIPVALVGHS